MKSTRHDMNVIDNDQKSRIKTSIRIQYINQSIIYLLEYTDHTTKANLSGVPNQLFKKKHKKKKSSEKNKLRVALAAKSNG